MTTEGFVLQCCQLLHLKSYLVCYVFTFVFKAATTSKRPSVPAGRGKTSSGSTAKKSPAGRGKGTSQQSTGKGAYDAPAASVVCNDCCDTQQNLKEERQCQWHQSGLNKMT